MNEGVLVLTDQRIIFSSNGNKYGVFICSEDIIAFGLDKI